MTPSFMDVETPPLNEVKNTKLKKNSKSTPNTKTSIVIVSKTGSLTECIVEPACETTLDELTVLLSKKCGYRNHDGFSCYHTFRYKNKKKLEFPVENEEVVPKYIYVDVWAKTDGRAGNENKYEMPPPIDEIIFYGNMALVARIDNETAINLTTDLWNIIYENLFGGFEDLAATAADDENEIDELEAVPAHKKTSNGYLKDGFIVEDDSEDKTPRCKKHLKGRGKKNKSESTESEFVTETDTETGTPPSDSPLNSDTDHDHDHDHDHNVVLGAEADPDLIIECDIVNTIVSKNVKPKRTNVKKHPSIVKSKKFVEEPVTQESETELSEEEYL
jgi:hypothetical protein